MVKIWRGFREVFYRCLGNKIEFCDRENMKMRRKVLRVSFGLVICIVG